jgi:AraC-like DNA-binding protein
MLTQDNYLRIVNAKLFIDENYPRPISLEQVSKQAFISKFHFHRLFRQVYKRTPQDYITQKRLNKAKELLAQNKSISEVCAAIGFESTASFTHLFKKAMGFPPTWYRNWASLQKQQARETPKKFIPGCFIDQYSLDRNAG